MSKWPPDNCRLCVSVRPDLGDLCGPCKTYGDEVLRMRGAALGDSRASYEAASGKPAKLVLIPVVGGPFDGLNVAGPAKSTGDDSTRCGVVKFTEDEGQVMYTWGWRRRGRTYVLSDALGPRQAEDSA